MPLRRRTSSFDQGRLAGAFFVRATALAMSSPVWYVSGTNSVLHELQSRATFANQYRHLAKSFEWRAAGDASARPIKSISPFGISTGATKLFVAARLSTRSLAVEARVPRRTPAHACRDGPPIASLRVGRGYWTADRGIPARRRSAIQLRSSTVAKPVWPFRAIERPLVDASLIDSNRPTAAEPARRLNVGFGGVATTG